MKNPTVKKIFACVAVLTVLTGSAQGAYKVEIDDDTYVSDEVYFAVSYTHLIQLSFVIRYM